MTNEVLWNLQPFQRQKQDTVFPMMGAQTRSSSHLRLTLGGRQQTSPLAACPSVLCPHRSHPRASLVPQPCPGPATRGSVPLQGVMPGASQCSAPHPLLDVPVLAQLQELQGLSSLCSPPMNPSDLRGTGN